MITPWAAGHVTIVDVLTHAKSLAIPAFQRGSVWSDSGRADLLISLAKGYFVGSLLLWRPATDDLPPGSSPLIPQSSPRFLLIDGQQRVRALLRTLMPPAPNLPAGRVSGRIWCAFREGNSLAFALRSFNGANPHSGAVPVSLLPSVRAAVGAGNRAMEASSYRAKAWKDPNGKVSNAVDVSLATAESWRATFWRPEHADADFNWLNEKMTCLLAARMDVRLLEQTDTAWTEADVIDNYRRLNQAGSRLRDDELEFARLVAHTGGRPSATLARVLDVWQDTVEEDIAGASVLTEDAESNPDERDELLERGDERQFGLALLVRTVRLARDVYTNTREETGDSIGDLPANPEQAARQRQRVDGWIQQAERAILLLARTLQELGCDWRARIPRRRSDLGSLLALLLRYPELGSTTRNRAHFRMLVLGVYLRPDAEEKGEDGTASSVVRDSLYLSEALERLDRWLGLQMGSELERLTKQFETVHAPNHRLTDLYYWWLRARTGAPDIHPIPAAAKPLTCRSTPERQHILPFSRIAFANDSPAPRRATAHLVNSIGNLTWISAEANSCMPGAVGEDQRLPGWGDKFMDVSTNAARDHLLVGDGSGDYDLTRASAGFGKLPFDALDNFSRARAKRVGGEFAEWWRHLRGASQAVGDDDRCDSLVPSPERKPSMLNRLAEWGYPPKFARLVERISRVPVYNSDANGWKSDGSRFRLRRRGKEGDDYLLRDRFEFDFRRPGESTTSAGALVISRDKLVVPALAAGGAGQVDEFAVPDDCDLAERVLERILQGWGR